MTSEQFKKVEDIFFRLQQVPPSDRDSAIDQLCGGDDLVRAEVRSMIGQEASGEGLSRFSQHVDRVVASAVGPVGEVHVGQRVGHYEIIRLLGQGGMGVVYLARDTRLARTAALKALLPGAEASPIPVERLRREARALAQVSHPNVATIYGLEEADSKLFLAMEYLEGKTLSQRLGRSAIPIADALTICQHVAAGVEAAHDAGVIHRDLKPANIMLTTDGAVKVLDFGLAREMRGGDGKTISTGGDTHFQTITRKGSLFGTPAYMSPEQARGELLDERSDIFSFGSVLFRCLTGRPAFAGETEGELVEGIKNHEPEWHLLPKNLPPSLLRILRRCLAKNPDDRYHHMGDVRLDLREVLAGRDWEALARSRSHALRWRIAAACMAALGVAGLVAAVTMMKHRPAAIATDSTSVQAQQFEVPFPENAPQSDLERLQVAITADGKNVAVACGTPDAGQSLWLRGNADRAWHRVDGTVNAHRPFFSDDGQWLGFFRDSQLYKRRLAGGGDLIRLADATNWYGATWREDGAIAYVSAWGQPIVQSDRPGADPKPLTAMRPELGDISHLGPVFVPGEKWVIYSAWTGGEECSIQATELATGKPHVVLRNASSPRITGTPRGTYLLYERASIIFAAPFDVATATLTGTETAIADGVLNDGTRFNAYFDVSRDGTLVYVPGSSFAEESRLAYVNADGETTTPFNDDRLSFSEPSMSADGSRVLVAIKGKLYRAYLYDLKRKTFEPILTGGDTVSAKISDDGQMISSTINKDGKYGIYLISLKDGTQQLLYTAEADYPSEVCWSPDGKSLVFSMSAKQGIARDVWIMDARPGATPRPLVATAASEEHCHISPDGKWVTFTSDANGTKQVYLASLPDGAQRRQISVTGGTWPYFGRDATKLYYRAQGKLWIVGLSETGYVTGPPTVAYGKPFGQSDPLARDYTIAADGRVLLIEPSERRPVVRQIRFITNWFAMLPDAVAAK